MNKEEAYSWIGAVIGGVFGLLTVIVISNSVSYFSYSREDWWTVALVAGAFSGAIIGGAIGATGVWWTLSGDDLPPWISAVIGGTFGLLTVIVISNFTSYSLSLEDWWILVAGAFLGAIFGGVFLFEYFSFTVVEAAILNAMIGFIMGAIIGLITVAIATIVLGTVLGGFAVAILNISIPSRQTQLSLRGKRYTKVDIIRDILDNIITEDTAWGTFFGAFLGAISWGLKSEIIMNVIFIPIFACIGYKVGEIIGERAEEKARYERKIEIYKFRYERLKREGYERDEELEEMLK